MKTKSYLFIAVIGVFFSLLISGPVQAAEVLTVEDFKQNIVVEEHLIKMTDNAIIMFDGSSSMGDMFKDTNTSKISILKESLQTRNSYFPNLGINFGLYEYAPKFKEVYAVQPYDRQGFADALNQLPSKAAGPTMLQRGLAKIEPVLQGLSGHTVVFLFTDGTYSDSENPVKKAQELADKYNVCFIMIGTAETKKSESFLQKIASVNSCSRVIAFESYINRPEYNSGALYVVKSNAKIVTLSDRKVVGLKTENILFDWGLSETDPVFNQELDQIGAFMQSHPEAFAVINGYSDNSGPLDYNLRLSRWRADTVASYLANQFTISPGRLVVMWYGPANPIARNETREGRALNRRVEIAIGGLK